MRLTASILALALFAVPALAEDPKPAPGDKKVEKKVEKKEKLFSPEYEDAPLVDVLSWLTREAGLEYDLSKAAQALSKRGAVTVRVVAKDRTAREILDLTLAQIGLSWVEKAPGQVKIMTSEEYSKDSVLEMYDVRELLADVRDFAGPDSDAFGPKDGGKTGGKGEPTGHSFKDPPPDEADAPRAKKPMEEPDKLKKLLRDGSGGDDVWGEGTSMDLVGGVLYVKAPWRVQVKVRGLLNDFRQFK